MTDLVPIRRSRPTLLRKSMCLLAGFLMIQAMNVILDRKPLSIGAMAINLGLTWSFGLLLISSVEALVDWIMTRSERRKLSSPKDTP